MRIAMISHSYPTFGGGYKGQFVHGLASALVNLGHQVFAVIPWAPGMENSRRMDGVYLKPYRARDNISYGKADNAYIRYPRPAVGLSLIHGLLTLYQLINKQQIDIVHAHWAIPMGFVAGLAKIMTSVPLVITMHGRDIRVNSTINSSVPTLWYVKPFLRFAFSQADRLIAVSNDYYEHARHVGAPEKKLQVIYNGVDNKRFFPSSAGTAEIRQRYSIAPQTKLILSVGSLDFHKGFDVLLKAMAHVLSVQPQAKLLIVGDGPEHKNLLALRSELSLDDKVIFVGRIPNIQLPPYTNTCDLFVMPSREESFGIAAVEAMACGKPVVGTMAGGLAETIDNGQTGLVVEPDNVEQLANAVICVLKDKSLAAHLGTSALDKIETDFNWMDVARRTIALYEDVICLK